MAANDDDGTGERLIRVYRSSKAHDLFLLVDDADTLARVPADLLARFGTAVESFSFRLSADRVLARADARAVLRAIAEHGYFLQLPPATVVAGNRCRR